MAKRTEVDRKLNFKVSYDTSETENFNKEEFIKFLNTFTEYLDQTMFESASFLVDEKVREIFIQEKLDTSLSNKLE